MKKTKKLDMWTVLSFVILLCYAVFLLYPMLNLLRQSVVTIDGAFTLEYFQKFFGKSYYLITLWNSFKVSIAVTIITLIIGVPLAYLYNMYEIKGKGLLQIIIILCSMSAPFIGAYSWILMLGNSGIIRKAIKSVLGITLPSIYGFNGILLVLSLQLFPLVFLYVSGAMKNIDNSLLEAAESMVALAKKSEQYFKGQNLKKIDSNIEDLEKCLNGYEYECYTYTHYTGQPDDSKLKAFTVVKTGYNPEFTPMRWINCKDIKKLGADDIQKIIGGFKEVRKAFEKRIDTYVKRYGTTKVNAWSYIRD